MAASRETIYLSDFSGGLNLTSQVQSLTPNESPDCLNMDFGLRGGFMLRGGFQSQEYDSVLNGARFLCQANFGSDVMLLASSGNVLLSWNGSAITNTTFDLSDTTDPVRGASFETATYFANGRSAGAILMQKWNGSSVSALANTFNDDYTAPDAGDMPLARLIAKHNGYMFVADTVESSVRYHHRIRFSHVQQPEDWATNDYFDVDPGDDGDPITAIVPFRDQLIIFRSSAVYVLYGYSRDEFFYEKLSSASGVSSPRSVAMNSGVLYWFSDDGQVMAYNGSGVAPLTDALRWWADSGKINLAGDHKLQWANGRLWLALVADSSESVDYWLFVYDPTTKSMTRYDKQITDIALWHRLDTEPDPLFLQTGDQNLYRYDRSYNVDTVDAGAGPVVTRIDGYYRTAWVTAGETASKKRWKRPRVTAAANGDTTLSMSVYHDFNEGVTVKTSTLDIVTDEVGLWGTMDWSDEWSAGSDDYYEFTRMPSAGSARAVQFKFSSSDNVGRWWVDSIAFPFRRKQVR